MEAEGVTPQVHELVEYARVLDAGFENRNLVIVKSVATQMHEIRDPRSSL